MVIAIRVPEPRLGDHNTTTDFSHETRSWRRWCRHTWVDPDDVGQLTGKLRGKGEWYEELEQPWYARRKASERMKLQAHWL